MSNAVGLTLLILAGLFLLRSEIVFHIRKRAIEKSLPLNRAGLKFTEMVFDLTKWRFKDFYSRMRR